jgi:hypothetical protein
MGLTHDGSGFLLSSRLMPMRSGAEAQPFCDQHTGVVYKLFDLRRNGSLGKKLAFVLTPEGEMELISADAVLADTVRKLSILHEAGAHSTELVGLSDDFCYLIAKQPLAVTQSYSEDSSSSECRSQFHSDRAAAIEAMRGVICIGTGLRQTAAVIAIGKEAWSVADLHERNIMRDQSDRPTIIDALIGPVSSMACNSLPALARAVVEATEWSLTGFRPVGNAFSDVCDDEL